MSCDNLPDNGAATRAAVVGFAASRSEELARWIEGNVAFPSTMVDRITPKVAAADKAVVERDFGISDHWPVVAEPFRQWVVEDSFCSGRPPLDEVGVEFVTDIAPYKLAKTRLLNGTHCALSYLGILLGHETTDTAMSDPYVSKYVEHLMRMEISPLLSDNAAMDLADYRTSVLSRLSNPGVSDTLSRLAARGSTKMPSYLLPSLREARAENRRCTLLILAVASWFRYLRGYDYQGRPIVIEDRRGRQLKALACAGGADPLPLLRETDIFGDLSRDVTLIESLEQMLADIDRIGPAALLRKAIAADRGRHLLGGRQILATPTLA
jgi:mannitol-1-phosphate/altronate dehydrogenase